jgi:hypothetical protein
MAGTRNKFMYSEFCVDFHQVVKQKDWILNPAPCVNDRPAFPVGYNAPRMPATLLANNAVDIESSLRGIGANNYIFPKAKVTPKPVQLPTVTFYDMVPLYLPKLPDPLTHQRPTNF